jgi:hypothetical protein
MCMGFGRLDRKHPMTETLFYYRQAASVPPKRTECAPSEPIMPISTDFPRFGCSEHQERACRKTATLISCRCRGVSEIACLVPLDGVRRVRRLHAALPSRMAARYGKESAGGCCKTIRQWCLPSSASAAAMRRPLISRKTDLR